MATSETLAVKRRSRISRGAVQELLRQEDALFLSACIEAEKNLLPYWSLNLESRCIRGVLPGEWLRLLALRVQRLALNDNGLSSLPSELALCQRIRYLNLRKNAFTRVPSAVFELENLEILDISKNNIAHLSSRLWTLPNLKIVNASHNKITTLPPVVFASFNAQRAHVSPDSSAYPVLDLSQNRFPFPLQDFLSALCQHLHYQPPPTRPSPSRSSFSPQPEHSSPPSLNRSAEQPLPTPPMTPPTRSVSNLRAAFKAGFKPSHSQASSISSLVSVMSLSSTPHSPPPTPGLNFSSSAPPPPPVPPTPPLPHIPFPLPLPLARPQPASTRPLPPIPPLKPLPRRPVAAGVTPLKLPTQPPAAATTTVAPAPAEKDDENNKPGGPFPKEMPRFDWIGWQRSDMQTPRHDRDHALVLATLWLLSRAPELLELRAAGGAFMVCPPPEIAGASPGKRRREDNKAAEGANTEAARVRVDESGLFDGATVENHFKVDWCEKCRGIMSRNLWCMPAQEAYWCEGCVDECR